MKTLFACIGCQEIHQLNESWRGRGNSLASRTLANNLHWRRANEVSSDKNGDHTYNTGRYQYRGERGVQFFLVAIQTSTTRCHKRAIFLNKITRRVLILLLRAKPHSNTN